MRTSGAVICSKQQPRVPARDPPFFSGIKESDPLKIMAASMWRQPTLT